jgi:hypothetical protein
MAPTRSDFAVSVPIRWLVAASLIGAGLWIASDASGAEVPVAGRSDERGVFPVPGSPGGPHLRVQKSDLDKPP